MRDGKIGIALGGGAARGGASLREDSTLWDDVKPGRGPGYQRLHNARQHAGAAPVLDGRATVIEGEGRGIAIGTRVFHQKFGYGAVLSADGGKLEIDFEEAGVKTDNRGFIPVDGHFRTNVEGIYAIGDVVPGPMLAHKAEEEGVACAEILAGQAGHVNYETVPGVVYTWPEVAAVGKTEEHLKDAGVDYNVGKFPFMANSRARANADTEGFVKILADAKTDRILGAHIIGPDAGTLIHEAVIVMEFGGSAQDLALAFHGHPTLNEAVKEAALAVDGRAIHA